MNQIRTFNRYPFVYIFPQIIAHLALFYAIFEFTPVDWFVSLVMYFFIIGLGISVSWHRMQAHKAIHLPKILKHVGIIFGCFAMQGTLLGWVAQHLQHHRHSDSPKDPHSPHHKNLFQLYWYSLSSLRVESRFIKLALEDRNNFFYHKHQFHIVVLYGILLSLYDPNLLLSAWLVPAAMGYIATTVGVGTLSHLYGYKNYDSKNQDKSCNNLLVALLVFGEGYQNNHHHQPYNPKFSVKRWEFDPLGYVCSVLFKKTVQHK